MVDVPTSRTPFVIQSGHNLYQIREGGFLIEMNFCEISKDEKLKIFKEIWGDRKSNLFIIMHSAEKRKLLRKKKMEETEARLDEHDRIKELERLEREQKRHQRTDSTYSRYSNYSKFKSNRELQSEVNNYTPSIRSYNSRNSSFTMPSNARDEPAKLYSRYNNDSRKGIKNRH